MISGVLGGDLMNACLWVIFSVLDSIDVAWTLLVMRVCMYFIFTISLFLLIRILSINIYRNIKYSAEGYPVLRARGAGTRYVRLNPESHVEERSLMKERE